VFTRALLPALVRPGLDLPGLALEVRKEVTRLASSVNHAQRPAYYDETSGDRIFLAGQQVAVVPPATLTVPAGHPCSGAATVSLAARRAAPLSAAEECSLKPKDSFQECGSCPEMVVVPAGSFTMGSPADEKSRSANEGPQHTVTISKPFAVGKFHVTRDQFAAFVQKTGYAAQTDCSREGGGLDGSWRDPGFAQEGSHPVVCVRWNDTKAYVDWVAKETGKPYRLLSEAEWEYAARGRTSPGAYPRFWFGDDEKEICRYANGDTSAWCNDGYKYTSPVGNYAPNAFGLYDMTGNAYQWLADCLYDDGYNGAPADGSAWTSGNCAGHAARGGSFRHYPWYLRAAYRNASHNANGNDSGFRLARTLTP
jgi:formylglycine-generating enzyme required for sulfatase activity